MSTHYPRFFITHAHQKYDVDFANRLASDLHKYSLDGFYDIYSVRPGDDIVASINEGLEKCDVYVPILSIAALKSPWCKEEINAAIKLSNELSRNGRPKIILALIEDCEAFLPPLLKTRLYVNFAIGYEVKLNELLEEGFGLGKEEISRREREHEEKERKERELSKRATEIYQELEATRLDREREKAERRAREKAEAEMRKREAEKLQRESEQRFRELQRNSFLRGASNLIAISLASLVQLGIHVLLIWFAVTFLLPLVQSVLSLIVGFVTIVAWIVGIVSLIGIALLVLVVIGVFMILTESS